MFQYNDELISVDACMILAQLSYKLYERTQTAIMWKAGA